MSNNKIAGAYEVSAAPGYAGDVAAGDRLEESSARTRTRC